MNQQLTFNDLVARYGRDMAYDLLLTIEKLAKIRNDALPFDEESRLQQALHVLNETDLMV